MCCNTDDEQPVLLHARIVFPPQDTILLDLPADIRRCSDGRSLLVESLSPEGYGVLIRLRYADSLISDSFPIVVPADTVAVPAAVVAIRYFLRETPHSYVLDSGRVLVQRKDSTIAGVAEGKGIENAIRMPARIEFRDVRVGTDSVACNYTP